MANTETTTTQIRLVSQERHQLDLIEARYDLPETVDSNGDILVSYDQLMGLRELVSLKFDSYSQSERYLPGAKAVKRLHSKIVRALEAWDASL